MDIFWAIIIVVGFWFIITYNRLITLKNRVKEAWADIDVQLKRRHDLIPNLIETVKGYAAHEKELFREAALFVHPRVQTIIHTVEYARNGNQKSGLHKLQVVHDGLGTFGKTA